MPDQMNVVILLRSTLLTALTARFGANAPAVRLLNQPQVVGATEGPAVTMQPIGSARIGSLRRDYKPGATPEAPMINTATQWWEATYQIGAFARRDPNDLDFLSLPTARDYCAAASYALQSDEGLQALAAQRVRPLRVQQLREIPWKNEADQYEASVSFDVTLSYPEILVGTTAPVVTFQSVAGRT